MSKKPTATQISIPHAVHILTNELGKLKTDFNNHRRDSEMKLGEMTETLHGSTPDLDAFVQTLRTINNKCAEQAKRIEKLEAALQVAPPAPSKKAKTGTIKIEPIEQEVSFS